MVMELKGRLAHLAYGVVYPEKEVEHLSDDLLVFNFAPLSPPNDSFGDFLYEQLFIQNDLLRFWFSLRLFFLRGRLHEFHDSQELLCDGRFLAFGLVFALATGGLLFGNTVLQAIDEFVVEIAQRRSDFFPAGTFVSGLLVEVLEIEDGPHLLDRLATEFPRLFGGNRRRQIRLLDFNVTPQLIGLDVARELIGEADDRFDSMP